MKLFNGDCLSVMQGLPDASVDLVLVDPPYGTTRCKWDTVIPLDDMWKQINRVLKPTGAACVFGSEPFSSALRLSNKRAFKYDWIYRKPQGVDPMNAKHRPLNDIEVISVFYRKQCKYNPQNTPGEPYRIVRDKTARVCDVNNWEFKQTETVNGGDRYPKRVLDFKQERGLHPTQKPVPLLEYLIRTYTDSGETVLDFTMGSGSTGVACVNTGRDFIGIEKDDGYFRIAKDRIEGG